MQYFPPSFLSLIATLTALGCAATVPASEADAVCDDLQVHAEGCGFTLQRSACEADLSLAEAYLDLSCEDLARTLSSADSAAAAFFTSPTEELGGLVTPVARVPFIFGNHSMGGAATALLNQHGRLLTGPSGTLYVTTTRDERARVTIDAVTSFSTEVPTPNGLPSGSRVDSQFTLSVTRCDYGNGWHCGGPPIASGNGGSGVSWQSSAQHAYEVGFHFNGRIGSDEFCQGWINVQ